MRHSSLFVSMGLAAMLVLAMPVGYTNFANAQSGPTVSDSHLKVERVALGENRLYRYELQGDHLVNPKLLLNLPALPGPRYNGGPVAVGPDGFVYLIIGDVEGHTTTAQNFQNSSAVDGT